MKALIWIGCIFGFSLCTTILKSCGITLGGIAYGIMCGGTFWLAIKLCMTLDSGKKVGNQVEEETIENTDAES